MKDPDMDRIRRRIMEEERREAQIPPRLVMWAGGLLMVLLAVFAALGLAHLLGGV